VTAPRLPIYVAVTLLLALAVTAGAMSKYSGLESRGPAPLPLSFMRSAPLLQLQFARQGDDIRQIVDTPPTTADNVRDAAAATRLDSMYFIPLYALLLAVAVYITVCGDCYVSRRAWVTLLVVILAAAAFDWWENVAIDRAVAAIAGGGAPAPDAAMLIRAGSLPKWTLLALVLYAMGGVLNLHIRRGRRAVGLVMLGLAVLITVDLVTYAANVAGSLLAAGAP
jgi:hypothetical protein